MNLLDTLTVIALNVEGESDAEVLSVHAFPSEAREDARKVFTELVREDELDSFVDEDERFTDEEIDRLFEKGVYANGTYILTVKQSEVK